MNYKKIKEKNNANLLRSLIKKGKKIERLETELNIAQEQLNSRQIIINETGIIATQHSLNISKYVHQSKKVQGM